MVWGGGRIKGKDPTEKIHAPVSADAAVFLLQQAVLQEYKEHHANEWQFAATTYATSLTQL